MLEGTLLTVVPWGRWDHPRSRSSGLGQNPQQRHAGPEAIFESYVSGSRFLLLPSLPPLPVAQLEGLLAGGRSASLPAASSALLHFAESAPR